MNKKILFLVAHRPGRSPGQRFRFEQYLKYLESSGFQYQISYLISEKDDAIFYGKGRWFSKVRIVLKSILRRIVDLQRAAEYDAVFLYREAIMLGTAIFEKALKRRGVKVVLDFDDSIWLNDTSDGNRSLSWLKNPSKTSTLVALSDLVIVGNKYLHDWAAKYSNNVHIIPTTIDTSYYLAQKKPVGSPVCIGWTGSSTTLKHLRLSLPVLRQLQIKYGQTVCFRVICDTPLETDLPQLQNVKWSARSEVEDLMAIDIGIMPLPDDAWSKGKCGFKGLQYMALEIPAVMSPVGVNTEIVSDGQNGFLAASDQEWFQKLSQLIESAELRARLGRAGRQTVVDRYSFDSQKEHFVGLFRQLCAI